MRAKHWTPLAAALMIAAPLTLVSAAQAASTISSNEGMSLTAGQLSVGSITPASLTGVIASSIQGQFPGAQFSDTTGSGAGWQGSMAASSFVYTGAWTIQGSAPVLASTGAGNYTGTTDGLQITVSVGSGATSTSTPFTWTDNSGGSGSGSATNGTAAAVEDGVTINFASGTTYTSGAQYIMDAGAQSPSALELLSSAGAVSPGSGVMSPAPTLVNSGATVLAGAGATYGTAIPMVSAALNQGMGSYTVAPGVDVVVDSSSWAATYTAQAQYTIASGPGSAPATVSSRSSGSTSLSSASTQQAAATTESYTGSAQTYTVPSGVTLIQVTIDGAGGYAGYGGSGGDGGGVITTLPVTSGETLDVQVGGQGTAPGSTTGSYGGGAPGGTAPSGTAAAGGGGASAIYVGGQTQADLLAIAGGGGGGAYSGGGGAGGNPGAAGAGPIAGGGGTQTAGGAAGSSSQGSGGAAGSAWSATGLSGGAGAPVSSGSAGGGGGGGYYGGGGGGGNTNTVGGSGGGGGASWAASSAQEVSYTTGANSGNGSVTIQPVGAAPPSNLTGSYDSSTDAVNLAWTASPSSGVLGYAVFRNGTEIGTTTGTSFADTSAPADTTVTYGVEALTSGLPSSQITANMYTGNYQAVVLTNKPTAFWEMADTSDSLMADSSGNGYNGSYVQGADGAIGFGQTGPLPGVVSEQFPGGSSSISGDATYGTYTPTTSLSGSYTVQQWVNMAPGSSGGKPFGTRSPNDYSFDYIFKPTGIAADIGTGSGWLTTSATYSITITAGQWYLVDWVVTPSGWDLYLDGTSVATGAFSGTPLLWDSGHYVHIGWSGFTGDPTFDGNISDTAVFSTALTSSQIQAMYP